MRKNILLFAVLLVCSVSHAQIGIGVPDSDASAVLEMSSTTRGFLVSRLTSAQRDSIAYPAVGLTIFNITKNCLEWYNGGVWYNGCGDQELVVSGSIASLDCSGAVTTGKLVSRVVASGVSSVISYTRGNSGPYTGQVVASTGGVLGLTATLVAGNFAIGSGLLTYSLMGIPNTAGIASFNITQGGQSCSFSVDVENPGSIASLDCSGAVTTGKLVSSVVASGVSSVISYTGGNHGPYAGQVVASTGGVSGLTATLVAGNFALGSGLLTYSITGTPDSTGSASFDINIGGKSCVLTIKVDPGLVDSLLCSQAVVYGYLVHDQPIAGKVKVLVPYIGGNGGTINNGNNVTSKSGNLYAALRDYNFAIGSGTLEYVLGGTAFNSTGAPKQDFFTIDRGGQSCSFSVDIEYMGKVGSLDCAGIKSSATVLYNNESVDGITFTVPYTEGNGGYYPKQVLSNTSDTTVAGLTATLPEGRYNVGSGTLVYTLSGWFSIGSDYGSGNIWFTPKVLNLAYSQSWCKYGFRWTKR